MYRLMLVEDEALVRESMIQNIDWEWYGFELAAACENGQEAIDRLPDVRPDVVVTDICMPLVDGLELARHLREHYPTCFVVILTGFNEFAYAQQAIKLRVHDLILKPVSPKEFCTILTRLAAELKSRDSQRSSMRSLQSRAHEAEATLTGALFGRLRRAAMTADEVREAAAGAGLTLDSEYYCALLAQTRHTDQSVTECQRLQDAARGTAARFPACSGALVDDCFPAILLGGRTQDEASRRARDAAAMLADAVGKAAGVPAQIGIGGCRRGLGGLHDCFHEAFHALGYGFVSDRRVIADEAARAAEQPVTPQDPLPSEREIVVALQAHDESGAQRLLDRLFQAMARRGLHRDACLPPLERLRVLLGELVPAKAEQAAPQVPPAEAWFDAAEVRRVYGQLIAFIHRQTLPDASDPAQRCVESAKGYILQRFHDSDFSLKELLSLLNVSKSYFSSVFKAQTGQTFVEYLTTVRMEKAKYLLTHTTLCTYEIADRVGFTDSHYFSVTFKRFTGKTPRDYREDPA